MTFDIGKAYSDAMGSFSGRLGSQIAVWAIFFAVQLGAMLVFALGMSGTMMALAGAAQGGNPFAGLGAGAFLMVILFYAVLLAVAGAAMVAQSTIASPLHRPSVGEAVGTGFRSMLTMLGMFALLLIAYIVLALVVGMVVGGLAAATGSSAVAFILGLLVLAGVAYVGTKLSLVAPVVGVDGERNPINALSRSWRLVSGNTFRVFLAYLIFIIGLIVIGGAIVLIVFMPLFSGGAVPGGGTMALMLILYLIFAAGLAIFNASLASSIHAQLSGGTPNGLGETFE